MKGKDEKQQVIIKRESSSKLHAKIIISERRRTSKDRRKINTYIEGDRRSGIADRRKKK